MQFDSPMSQSGSQEFQREGQSKRLPAHAWVAFPARTWSDERPFRPFAPWSGHALREALGRVDWLAGFLGHSG